jgi:hypothetical protein
LFNYPTWIANYFPFNNVNYNKKQIVYYPSDFPNASAGNITTIYIKANTATTPNFTTLKVRLGHSTLSTFTNTFVTAGMQTVYNAPYNQPTITTVNGEFLKITLQTPFYYNHTSNLIVELSQEGFTEGMNIVQADGSFGNRTLYGHSADVNAHVHVDCLAIFGFDMVCVPSYSYGCSSGDYIADFTLIGATDSLYNVGTLCASGAFADYTTNTDIGLADMIEGETYNGTITTHFTSPDEYYTIWIDYNENGVFETTEQAATGGPISATIPGAYAITVPTGTTPGLKRMRVVLAFGSSSVAPSNPCGSYLWGETNDYLVRIDPACPVVNLGNDTTDCVNGGPIILTAGTFDSYVYAWNTGDSTSSIAATESGTYIVSVTNAIGCTATDTVMVMMGETPSVNGITVIGTAPNFIFSADNPIHITDYIWDFGDGTTATTQHASHVYVPAAQDETYTVTLIAYNDCSSDTVTTSVMVPATTSINDLKLSNEVLKMYPNPTANTLTIENTTNFKIKQIVIFNVLGQEVLNTKATGNAAHTLDVSHLISGFYNVNIELEEGTVKRKLAISK